MEKRRRLTPAERRAIYDKMGGRCAYCGEQLNYEDMQVDHVVALRSEGEDDLANMLPACRSCNHYKRGNSLEGWRRILEAMPVTLERDCYTYRQAVRFGMVKPTPKKITFYFERVGEEHGLPRQIEKRRPDRCRHEKDQCRKLTPVDRRSGVYIRYEGVQQRCG